MKTHRSLCSPETAARACQALLAAAGGEGKSLMLPKHAVLARQLQLSEMHMGRVLRQLRSDGRLVPNPDRSWSVYSAADPSRVREAAKKIKQRGSVFDLQQTVNTLLQEITALRSELTALRPAPAPAAPAEQAQPANVPARKRDPLRVEVFFKARDEAEMQQFMELRNAGTGTLADQTAALYRACIAWGGTLPILTNAVTNFARKQGTENTGTSATESPAHPEQENPSTEQKAQR